MNMFNLHKIRKDSKTRKKKSHLRIRESNPELLRDRQGYCHYTNADWLNENGQAKKTGIIRAKQPVGYFKLHF